MVVRRLNNNELYHHGIKGQRWGVRRYQNPDGSLTDAGKRKIARKIKNSGGYDTGLIRVNQSTYKNKDLVRKHISKDTMDEYVNTEKKWSKAVDKYNKYYPNMSKEKEKEMWNDIDKYNEEHEKITKKAVEELVGKYSNKKVKVLNSTGTYSKQTVGDLVSQAIWNVYIEDYKK